MQCQAEWEVFVSLRVLLDEYVRMNPSTESTSPEPGQDGGQHAAREWLDALATGACDQDTFLREVNGLNRTAPDAVWETLSLLDQYYRLGIITSELFHAVKSHLQGQALGRGPAMEVSVPLPPPPRLANAPQVTVPVRATASRDQAAPNTATAKAPAVGVRETDSSPARPHGSREGRALAEGDVLRGRYRLVRIRAHGGMGTVFEAIDQYRADLPMVDQKLAIKVLHTEVTQRQDLVAELRSEFYHLQSLSHPNIVRVFDFDCDGDTAFLTMELLSGVPLSRVLNAQVGMPLARPYALAIIRDVGAALAHAHSRGIVHGDVNPCNILITNDGEVRVLDFGASQTSRTEPWSADSAMPRPFPVAVPGYASCHLLGGQAADWRDDLYAFACTAYVLLTGMHPFGGRTAVEARALRLRLRRPGGLTRRQWRALRAALNFERSRRPANLEECLRRLDSPAAARRLPGLSALMTPSRRSRRGSLVTAAGVLIVLLAAGGAWVTTKVDAPLAGIKAVSSTTAWALTSAGTFIERVRGAALTRAGTGADPTGHPIAAPAPSHIASTGTAGATGQRPLPPATTAADAAVSGAIAAPPAAASQPAPSTIAASASATTMQAASAARQAAAPQPAPRALSLIHI